MTNEEVIEKLNEFMVHLRALQSHIERIGRELERDMHSRRISTPSTPATPSNPIEPMLPVTPYNPIVSTCPVCGIDLDKANMYACTNPACYNRIVVTC